MSLVAQRQDAETWRDAVKRIAGAQGLEAECLDLFDAEVDAPHFNGDEAHAAWCALYEWDCLDFRPDPPAVST